MHFAIDNAKILYLPISKNACTTLKSLMVELSDLPEELKSEIFTTGVQHYAARHRTGLMLHERAAGEAETILADPGYFRFAVVRDPFDRLVSAYVDKFVTHRTRPGYLVDSAPVVAAVQGVTDAEIDAEHGITFRQFVEYVTAQPPWSLNNHWRPQIENFHDIRIDRLYDFADLDALGDDLGAHLGRPVTIGQRNRLRTRESATLEGAADLLPGALDDKAKALATECFFDDALRRRAARYYHADAVLYASVRETAAERRRAAEIRRRVGKEAAAQAAARARLDAELAETEAARAGLEAERDALRDGLAAAEAARARLDAELADLHAHVTVLDAIRAKHEASIETRLRKTLSVNGLRRLTGRAPIRRRT